MCGIAGIICSLSENERRERLTRMTRRISHRGPDAEGMYVDENIALGHRRLSIIDLSDDANQPMTDASGRYVLVFNGEIYNYKTIKASLPEYVFRTRSDSEVILAAYARWGAACLNLFNGMFAFAIWDKERAELFVARDRLGVKPFYYYTRRDTFVFASELRSILASGFAEAKLNPEGARNFLMYQSVYAPLTIVKDVFRLMPGEYGIFRKGGFEKTAYWSIECAPQPDDVGDPVAVRKHIRTLLTDSVELRMSSDVPLGAFLSGGIDSSAIVGLMSECSSQPVNTFSINFEEPEYDESRYSALIAKRFNTRHNPLVVRASDFLDTLTDALNASDTPSGDGFNSYLISRITRSAGISVALSGIGGDELFAGYPSFLHWLRLHRQWWWYLPTGVRRPVASVLRQFDQHARLMRLADILAVESPDIENIYPSMRQVLAPEQAKILLRETAPMVDPMWEALASRSEKLRRFPLLSQYTMAELLGYASNVLLKDTDQMSMASALEVREPFFDYRLIEYVIHIPDHIKYPNYPKQLLVESLSPLLPDEIIHRPKKGFSLPWKLWLRNELRNWCLERIDNLCDRPAFNADAIRRITDNFFQSSEDHSWMQVLQMAALEDWLERNEIEA